MEIIKDESQFSMLDWWKKAFIENYANFEGRARRSEYWYYILFNFILTLSAWILSFVFIFLGGFLLWFVILGFNIACIIPNLAVQVRRLHDVGKSGWTILFALIPLVGPILLLVYYCTEGDRGDNEYGRDPKMTIQRNIDNLGTH
ncbi:DUF805 domain-containing protein [Flavobacteriaceae bacterium S356]|uniref:DUF805 domain-containing protein n=1 Tax=Asprobacillus argus TaxID=3076534 RepID=A0ABU3LAJ5_9FLAO|nr:DUF805 domain-containing protein [Flavobacteriaceae bacterium S356]